MIPRSYGVLMRHGGHKPVRSVGKEVIRMCQVCDTKCSVTLTLAQWAEVIQAAESQMVAAVMVPLGDEDRAVAEVLCDAVPEMYRQTKKVFDQARIAQRG